MLRLGNRELTVELLDPADAIDAARQGSRFCWGGYIWQVHDAKLGALLAGPEFPKSDPTPFNGQGLPESFRHRQRDTNIPFTWSGQTGLAVGAGKLTTDAADAVTLTEPCQWTITPFTDRCVFHTRQSATGFSYELTRTIELHDRTIKSTTQLTNLGTAQLALEWFAHPFWAITNHRARLQLPAGTTVPANPGFTVADDGTLSFQRAFVRPDDSQFSLLALPPNRALELTVDHPALARVGFATSFVPDECPVWANAHTVSVEPYLRLSLAPGESRRWQLRHSFESQR
jgi:hypothetical protein